MSGVYFVDCEIDFAECSMQDLDFFVIRKFNNEKCGNHAVNKIIRNVNGDPIAIRCNCNKKTYHLVMGGEILWEDKTSPQDIQRLRQQKISPEKQKWISED